MNPYWWNYGMMPNLFGPQVYNPFSVPPPPTTTTIESTTGPSTIALTAPKAVSVEEKTSETPSACIQKPIKHKQDSSNRRSKRPHPNHSDQSSKRKRSPFDFTAGRVILPPRNEQTKKRSRRKAKASIANSGGRNEQSDTRTKETQNRISAHQQSTQNNHFTENRQLSRMLEIAVMAIAMALQPAEHAEKVAAPDGIDLD